MAAARQIGIGLLLSAMVIAGALLYGPKVKPAVSTYDAGARCELSHFVLASTVGRLPHTRAMLHRGGMLRVVAIGSSSTWGSGASDRRHAYPARLQAYLTDVFPEVNVIVINKGINGNTTEKMVARFDNDVFAQKPDLVIWQTGTNDVLKGQSFARFRDAFTRGLTILARGNFDIVLMDPQYAPRFFKASHHDEILSTMRLIAAQQGIPYFPRYAIMKKLSEEGRYSGMALLAKDGLHMNDMGYDCTAHILADEIALAAR